MVLWLCSMCKNGCEECWGVPKRERIGLERTWNDSIINWIIHQDWYEWISGARGGVILSVTDWNILIEIRVFSCWYMMLSINDFL